MPQVTQMKGHLSYLTKLYTLFLHYLPVCFTPLTKSVMSPLAPSRVALVLIGIFKYYTSHFIFWKKKQKTTYMIQRYIAIHIINEQVNALNDRVLFLLHQLFFNEQWIDDLFLCYLWPLITQIKLFMLKWSLAYDKSG